MNRVVVIGNSGSGKTFFATRLKTLRGLPVVHLDHLFWEPGGFNAKRPPEVVHADIARLRDGDRWLVEGVFGELATPFLERADLLVWLDLPWPACRQSLLARGSESARQRDPERAEENFRQLLTWAEAYDARTDLRSRAGHAEIFAAFRGAKRRFLTRMEVDGFLAPIEHSPETAALPPPP